MIIRFIEFIKILERIIDFIIKKGYQLTPSFLRDKLNLIRLEKPKVYRPTADISTILQWERMFDRYNLDGIEDELRNILANLVITEEHHEQNFDFSRIQSLSASKSFGCGHDYSINGSWFKDIASWGEGMYPGRKLSALDEADWSDNIRHIEHEGFHKGSNIHVYYYTWFDRYLASNSGGSHHAALVAYQIKNQGMVYKRDANITTYRINEPLIKKLDPYFCFITGSEAITPCFGDFYLSLDWILTSFAVKKIYTFDMNATENNCTLFIVPKRDLIISPSIFESWLNSRAKTNEIIRFEDILMEHARFCTTPYTHELRSIHLGDPTRRNDIEIRKHGLKGHP
ncbi:TPA: DUF6685 family protein [Serratia marcescens]|uniref:DUF6685 family protein n=1 Tax=Serratia TaxID=613 RepID=UPI00148D96EF|nr:DUF6685 family protein [Serratia marcescens]